MSIEFFWGGEDNSYRRFNVRSAAAMAAAKTGMSGNYCLNLSDTYAYVAKSLTAASEYYFGSRRWFASGQSQTVGVYALFKDETLLVDIRKYGYDGVLYAMRGSTVVGTGITAPTLGTTHLIEAYVKLSDTVGRIVVKLNGIVEIDYTGDTMPGTDSQMNKVLLGMNRGSQYVDDFVVRTDDYPGDVRVGGKAVNGTGTTNDFTPSSGTINDCLSDGSDATYGYSNTPDAVQLCTKSAITESIDSIQAMQLISSARYQGTSLIKNLQLGVRSGGNNYFSSDKVLPTDFGVDLTHILETDPADSAALTVAKIDSMEIGFKGTE